jgi:hypothetical protein
MHVQSVKNLFNEEMMSKGIFDPYTQTRSLSDASFARWDFLALMDSKRIWNLCLTETRLSLQLKLICNKTPFYLKILFNRSKSTIIFIVPFYFIRNDYIRDLVNDSACEVTYIRVTKAWVVLVSLLYWRCLLPCITELLKLKQKSQVFLRQTLQGAHVFSNGRVKQCLFLFLKLKDSRFNTILNNNAFDNNRPVLT